MKQSKCDFCDKPMVAYGAYGSYQACEDHIKDGEAVEAAMFKEIEDSLSEIELDDCLPGPVRL